MKFLVALLFCAAIICSPARAENYLVLPLFNLTGDASVEWIGESLAEAIREALASEGIIALDRGARQEAYKRLSIRPNSRLTKASVIRLGEALDADQVIFGTYDISRERSLRIAAQIINIRGVSRGPEYAELGVLDDLAKLQNHLAWQTLHLLLRERAPSEQQFLQMQPVLKIGAIESYVRGLLAASGDQKLKLFSQAVRIEPRYSQANYELGKLHYGKKSYRLAAEHFQKVQPQHNSYRTATFLLGLSYYHLSDFAAAERSFREVAQAVPLNEVWNNLAAAQS
ncbi:MAG TPA: hypothetical protein VEQ63_10260, partial [Bryobacteraceae bacterium]|nr:hypothetical protein [Bryobacteraceae bacterium]